MENEDHLFLNNTNNNNNQQNEIIQFIEACNLLNDDNIDKRCSGEKYLLGIKNRPYPYEFCLNILEISNEGHVQFHALRTICDAFLNEWYNLSIDYVDQLRSKLLLFPVHHNNKGALSGYVLNEIAKCSSIMYKRKWKENDDSFNKQNIWNKIQIDVETLLSSDDPSIVMIGLALFNELIAEFSVNNASSALGLTFDFHLKCHRAFETHCLQHLFILLCKLFQRILSVLKSGKYVFEMINMTAIVIEKCLSFNFIEKTSDDKLIYNDINTNALVQPGPSWNNVLIKSDLLQSLNMCHQILYTKYNDNQQFNPTVRVLRESIICIYSLSGRIFDENGMRKQERNDLSLSRITFLKRCLISLKQLYKLIDDASKDNELLIDICRMFQVLCNNFRYELLIEINEFGNVNNPYYFFEGIRDCGDLLIKNMDTTNNEEINEGFDILIQSIVTLIHCYEIRKRNLQKQSTNILSTFANVSKCMFVQFVEKMLENSEIEIKNGALQSQYYDDEYLDERLLGIAMIGRINSRDVLPYLTKQITAILSEIKVFKANMNKNNNIIPKHQHIHLSIMHEKLFWLFQFLGYTLCDDPSREETTIPSILMISDDDSILVQSIYPLFEWIQFENECIQNSEKQLLSPFLAKTCISMLCRWSCSYLMINSAYYKRITSGILNAFGSESTDSINTLNMLIYKCYINVFQWREERDVVHETCLMLETFAKHRSIKAYLFKSQSFNSYILNKYYDNTLNLHLLRPNKLVSVFIRIVLQSVICGEENMDGKLLRFNKITEPIYSEFIQNCEPFINSNSNCHNTEQISNLEISLYKLHGMSQIFSDLTFDFMLQKQIFHILIQIICKVSNYHELILMIFKIFADVAETSWINLNKNQSKLFLNLCVHLIEQFEKYSIKKHTNMDRKTREKYEEMQVNEIIVILKLLELMSTQDLIDINLNTSESEPLLCGQCIFKSLYYLAPQVTATLLQYQFLCKRFYEVLGICVCSFTSTFATKLNNEQRNVILGKTLFESLSNGEYQIMEYCLEIIECLAEYQLEHASASPFLLFLQKCIHPLFMLWIDLKTPKLLHPKLCETLLPVLMTIGKEKLFQYLFGFINNICKNGTKQKQKLADKFTILIEKINSIECSVVDMQSRVDFREYFIQLSHDIRTIVTVH